MIAVPLCLLMLYMARYYVLKDEHKKLQKEYIKLIKDKD
jgi:hypothetical protein